MKWLAILLTLIFAIAKVMGYFPSQKETQT